MISQKKTGQIHFRFGRYLSCFIFFRHVLVRQVTTFGIVVLHLRQAAVLVLTAPTGCFKLVIERLLFIDHRLRPLSKRLQSLAFERGAAFMQPIRQYSGVTGTSNKILHAVLPADFKCGE